MKPDELMLGDWVFVGNKPYKVASLSCMENPELESDKYIFHCLKDEIAPIPLTPEILEKNGWFPLDEYRYEGDIALAKGRDYFRLKNTTICINSVHELQHALRLFSINKKIEI